MMYKPSDGQLIAPTKQSCMPTATYLSEDADRPLLAVNDEEASKLIGHELCMLFDKAAHGINFGLS